MAGAIGTRGIDGEAPPLDRSARRALSVWLVPGVSTLNGFSYYWAAFVGIGLLAFINVSQPYVLTEIVGVPPERQGRLIGLMTSLQEIIAIVIVGQYGALSEKIGRRLIYAFGFLAVAASYVLYPLASNEAELILYRCLFGIGAAAITSMSAIVLSDYPQERNRGKMVGISALFNGFGLVLIVVVLTRVLLGRFEDAGMSPADIGRALFLIAACIGLFTAVILKFGLQPGTPTGQRDERPFLTLFKIGVAEAGRNRRVALSFLAAFAGRGDIVVIGTFFSLWAQQSLVSGGMTSGSALERAGILFALVQTAALFAGPVMGLICDRLNRVTGMAVCFGSAVIGYAALALVGTPDSPLIYLACVLVGIGEVAAIIGGQSLIGQAAPLRERGAVIGVFGMCGGVGILIATSLGGFLFDFWAAVGPFWMMVGFNALVVVCAIWVRLTERQPRAAVPHG